MAAFGQRDRFATRLAAAAAVALLVFVLAALFGPAGDPTREWYEHTGYEGDLVLLDDIDVVSDLDPTSQPRAQALPGATEGVPTPLTDRNLVDRTLDPVPLERPQSELGDRRELLQRTEPSLQAEIVAQDQVEMSRASQQSSDFVLLHAVNPRYPDDAAPALRRRDVVVRVNMYVDESGHVQHAYVDRNDGGPRFEQAVLEAVRQWVYRPLVRDGRPTGFWDLIYFVFKATGSTSARESAPANGG